MFFSPGLPVKLCRPRLLIVKRQGGSVQKCLEKHSALIALDIVPEKVVKLNRKDTLIEEAEVIMVSLV